MVVEVPDLPSSLRVLMTSHYSMEVLEWIGRVVRVVQSKEKA